MRLDLQDGPKLSSSSIDYRKSSINSVLNCLIIFQFHTFHRSLLYIVQVNLVGQNLLFPGNAVKGDKMVKRYPPSILQTLYLELFQKMFVSTMDIGKHIKMCRVEKESVKVTLKENQHRPPEDISSVKLHSYEGFYPN